MKSIILKIKIFLEIKVKFKILELLIGKSLNSKIKRVDVILICHDYNRGMEVEGKAFSPLIDPIHTSLVKKSLNVIQVAIPGSKLIGDKAFGNPESLNYLFNKINKIKNFNDKIPFRLFKRIFNLLLPNSDFDMYYYLLKKRRPKFVMVINAAKGLCRAGRLQNIPIVEVNHGFGYLTHWVRRRSMDTQPSHILSLDKISTKSIINDLGSNVGKIKVVEFPHPFYQNNLSKEVNRDIYIKRIFPKTKLNKPKVILLSLVWAYAGDHDGLTFLANILPNGLIFDELIKAIELTEKDVLWCIRRHPLQVRLERYDYQKKFLDDLVCRFPNCDWEVSTKLSLTELFDICDGHITMSSSTAYDAAIFGVKTLFLCPTLRGDGVHSNMFEDLVQFEYAIKGKADTNEIIKWIDSVQRTNPYKITDATMDDFDGLIEELLGAKQNLN